MTRDEDGQILVPGKVIAWIVAAITVPLMVLAFNDLRSGVRDAKAEAKTATERAASAQHDVDLTAKSIEQIVQDISEIKNLLKERRR